MKPTYDGGMKKRIPSEPVGQKWMAKTIFWAIIIGAIMIWGSGHV